MEGRYLSKMTDQSSASKSNETKKEGAEKLEQEADGVGASDVTKPEIKVRPPTANSGQNRKEDNGLVDFCYKNFTSFRSAIDGILGAKQEEKQVLSSLDIEGVAELIRENKANRVIVMCGAGISTSAGIPDFRSPGSGLYDNLAEYNLPDPLAVFDINFFRQKPEPFFAVARKLFPENLKPTPCHYFIRLLDQKGVLRRCFTQVRYVKMNIDSLEYVSGLSPERIVTAHGSYHTGRCLSCNKKYTLEWMRARLYDDNCKVFRCDSCKGIVKPDIVFFGENLPGRFFRCAATDFPQCDLLIIMGTSLVVQPFAGMVNEVGKNVPRLLINLTEAGNKSVFEGLFGSPSLRYGREDNYRDVFWKGTCDDGVM
ncbi:unnamed protein product, partial [Enterobius vermicularis]|uniref:NAD-dependent protein deacetylase n=1 Tax=Enterobius vermicularis TaxID=51028 RepID=A0A0N4V5P7_ENTVE